MKTKSAGIFAIVVSLILGASFALAHGGYGPGNGSMMGGMYGGKAGPMSGPGYSYIFDQLDVTEDQQAQLETLMNDFRDEMRATMSGRTERPTQEEMDSHRTLLKDRLATVLTAEQVDGLDAYMGAHNGRQGFGGMGKRGCNN